MAGSRQSPCDLVQISTCSKPEPLGGNLNGWWSRRINQEHRLVYRSATRGICRRWKSRSAGIIVDWFELSGHVFFMDDHEPLKSDKATDFRVRFIKVEVGNFDFEVTPFGRFQATCYNDPFPDMLLWLEAIAGGIDVARWVIDCEGSADQLLFSAATNLWCSHTSAQIVHISGSEDFCGNAASCLVKRRSVVEQFYSAFRIFIDSDQYDPKEWEYQWDLNATFEDMPDDAHSWDGERLSSLRSPIVESYLTEKPAQLELIAQPKHEWRPVRDD